MFSSTIIPTVGRATLKRAVSSVLEQSFDAEPYEVIVVNDSGQPLPDEEWLLSRQVRIVNTNRRERSVARNAGAAIAKGKYLHFLDDDDWLLPGALQTFWDLDQQENAIWLYGSYRTVNNEGELVHEWQPGIAGNVSVYLISGESIPFQNSLLLAEAFFAAGGFDQHPELVGVEDRELGRRLALIGAIGYASESVAAIRIGEESSTTNWAALAQRDQAGRERALQSPATRSRLRAAGYSSYWSGRLARSYLASAIWNLRRGRVYTMLSRATSGAMIAGHHPLAADFWKGIRGRAE